MGEESRDESGHDKEWDSWRTKWLLSMSTEIRIGIEHRGRDRESCILVL